MNSLDLYTFLRRAVADPSAGMIVSGGITTPRAVLFDEASRLSEELARHLMSPLIYLSLPNSVHFPVALLSIWAQNRPVGLLSPKYGASELQAIDSAIGIDEVLSYGENTRNLAETIGLQPVATFHLLGGNVPPLILFARDGKPSSTSFDSDDALVKFSSGSTGIPKGVLLTAGQISAGIRGVQGRMRLTREDTILVVTPLCHSYAFDIALLISLASGARLIMQDGFIPRSLVATFERESVTVLLGVPAMYRALLETRLTSQPQFDSLRWALSCTAPLAPQTINQFRDRFGISICQHYGSSETGGVTLHDPARIAECPQSVGLPLPHATLSIHDESGREISPGSEGEIVIRGTAVAKKYVMGGPPTATPLCDGTFRTGDRGALDSDGFLTVFGRIDALINVGGQKVSPVEVAMVLESHPAVREAAVTGRSDSSGEQWVFAAVVTRMEVSEAELVAFCRSAIAEYKVPRRIEFMPDLPRTASGKAIIK